MNKNFKTAICVLLCGCMVAPLAACSACDPKPNPDEHEKTYKNDPEVRPVVMGIGALDNNFNPFFSTSANDGEVAAMTQISMLTSNKDAEPVFGEDQPTVALDYKSTMYTANHIQTANGDMNGTTEYEFIIKNGIKFSDGVDLTIDDVLFNLYVYLDPSYTGSSTIYSTAIQGLKAYQAQDPDMGDNDDADYSSGFYADAAQRVYNIISHVEEPNRYPATDQINKDIALTKELFRKEVESDWTSCYGALESYNKEYSFTEDWQVYYLNEGLIQVKTELNANGATVKVKDANGKYVTTLDDADNTFTEEMHSAMNDATRIAEAKTKYGCNDEDAKGYIMRDVAIDTVYSSYTAINSQLADILRYWATGSNVLERFAAEERTKYYESMLTDGQLKVKNISGITTYKTSELFDGTKLSEEHDVLKIVVNGVDPKAVWNFSFTVAPMHYYSNEEETTKALNDKNNDTYFGVKFGDDEFFEDVLKNEDKNGLPVGAGVYKASSIDGKNVSKSTFFNNNFVYYERNTFFETVGSGLHNAKIRKLIYKVVGEDKILNALKTGEIDYGTPSATTENIGEIGQYSHLGYRRYLTGGYGYIGINPKFVPDYAVRRALMKGMDTSLIIKGYYTEELAQTIYRPMSATSWAYPQGCSEYSSIAYTTSVEEIQALVESAGWRQGNSKNEKGVNIYEKNGKQLKFTFTIAGETTDHPAYAMFCDAEAFLESCGFDITVQTDIQALKKLATGDLAVWAAAWSSSIDPDMYQIYHKDSKATSVKNWNRDGIVNGGDEFAYEQGIVDRLSKTIDEARQTINQDARIAKYHEALDLVMDLAVELPTYQRNDLVVYNTTVIDVASLNQNPSWTEGVISKLWELDYV